MAHLDRSGLERRPLGPKLTGPRLARAIELYESGLSLQAIGNEFGVDAGTVRRALRGADIAICKRRGWQPCPGLPDELLVPVPAATCGGRDLNSEACPTDGVGRARCPRSLR